jgi:type I thyroxine 5'-deiodinase
VPDLNTLYRTWRDRAAFYIVYIQEAHPVDAWQVSSNLKDDVLEASTTTPEERGRVAGKCVKNLGIEMPALIDGTDDAVERAYTGWPDRLYVIDTEGRVAFKSAPGPFGFEPEGVAAVLERLLGPPPGPS